MKNHLFASALALALFSVAGGSALAQELRVPEGGTIIVLPRGGVAADSITTEPTRVKKVAVRVGKVTLVADECKVDTASGEITCT